MDESTFIGFVPYTNMSLDERKGREARNVAAQTVLNMEIDENIEEENDTDAAYKRVETFVTSTTFHGFDQIFTSASLCSKLFWVCTMVAVMAVAFIQLKTLMQYFLKNPTLTSINVRYPQEGLEIPSLTICTLTKLNVTAIREKYPNMNKTLSEFSTASFFSAYSTSLMDFDYFYRKNMSNVLLQKAMLEAFDGRDLNTFFHDAAFQCRGQFLFCWFENGELGDCCNDTELGQVTVKRYLVHSGTCFELQTHGTKQRIPGPVGGFGFAYWYPNNHILQTAFNSYDEHAVHLFMSPANAMLEKNPTVLPVGYHNHISLTATRITRLLKDALGRSTCELPTLKYFDEYSYGNCEVECLVDAMLEHCNCTGLTTYGDIPQDKICLPLQSLRCFTRMADNLTGVLLDCRKSKCEEACHHWSYRATLTVGKTFNPILSKQLLEYWRLPHGNADRSLILGDVYFDEIQYMDIEQHSAFNIETFVSSIGGAMGLWTGASVITWIHLLFFCCSSLCKKKKKQSKTDRNENHIF